MARVLRWGGRLLVALVLFVLAAESAWSASAGAAHPIVGADAATAGPVVQVDPSAVKEGDRVRVTAIGFDVPYVTASVCGNNALRGSSDCNMVASKGFELRKNGESTWTEFQVALPPVPCPCVVRVSSTSNNQSATVPIQLTGHPSAPVTGPGDPGQPLVEVAVHAVRVNDGFLRGMKSSLGGAITYDVTVSVHNLTTDVLRKVVLTGSVGRSVRDVSGSYELENPAALPAGGTSEQTVRVEMPAPSVGTFVFSVTAAGAGPIVVGQESVHPTPWLLVVLVCLFVLDIGLLVMRRLMSRRAHRDAAASSSDLIDTTATETVREPAEQELVGTGV